VPIGVGHCLLRRASTSGVLDHRRRRGYLDLWVRSMEQYQQTMDEFLLAYKRGMPRS